MKPSDLIIGRETELEYLKNFLEKACLGQLTLVFLPGEAGSGKSTILNSFGVIVNEAHPKVMLINSHCASESSLNSLAPFRIILEEINKHSLLLHGKGRNLKDGNKWLLFLKEVAPAWLDIFASGIISAIKTTVEESNKLLNPELEFSGVISQQSLFEQFADILAYAATEVPLTIFIDDLQWADNTSLQLLHFLYKRLPKNLKILFVCAYRPSDMSLYKETIWPRIQDDLVSNGAKEIAEIKAFLDVNAYLDSRYPTNNFPQRFRQLIERKTNGHPLFLAQLMDYLEDERVVQLDVNYEPPIWRNYSTSQWEETTPPAIRLMIEHRLQRIEDSSRLILEAASVEGEKFYAIIVTRCVKYDDLKGIDILEVLELRHKLINYLNEYLIEGEPLTASYIFSHKLIQEVAYKSLHPLKKRLLHRQMAESLLEISSSYPNLLRNLYGRLSEHYREAGYLIKACEYALLAGQSELQIGGVSEAEIWLRQAIDFAGKFANHSAQNFLYQANIWLARTLTTQGRWAEARKSLLDIISQRSEQKNLEAHLELGKIYYQEADYKSSIKHNEFVINNSSNDSVVKAYGHLNLSETYLIRGGYENAKIHAAQTLELAQQAGQEILIAQAIDQLGWVHVYSGEFRSAIEYANESLSLFKKLNNSHGMILSYRVLGYAYQGLGAYGDSEKTRRLGLELSRMIKDRVAEGWLLFELGELHQELEDWEQAEFLHQSHFNLIKGFGEDSVMSYAYDGLGRVKAHLGQLETGLDYLNKGLKIRELLDEKPWVGLTLCHLSEAYLIAGNSSIALNQAKRAVEILETLKDPIFFPYSLLTYGIALNKCNLYGSAIDILLKAKAEAEKISSPSIIAKANEQIGIAKFHLGDKLEACDWFKNALLYWENLGVQKNINKLNHRINGISEFDKSS